MVDRAREENHAEDERKKNDLNVPLRRRWSRVPSRRIVAPVVGNRQKTSRITLLIEAEQTEERIKGSRIAVLRERTRSCALRRYREGLRAMVK